MPQHRDEDRYSNLLSANVLESAAGTITFQEIVTGISLGQGIGMLIDQIDYYPSGSGLELLVATLDQMQLAWTVNTSLSSLNPDTSGVIHTISIHTGAPIGTPASNGRPIILPLQYQFFPAMIVASPRLYFACVGTNLAAVFSARSRLYFRYVSLSSQEYLELAEAFVLVG